MIKPKRGNKKGALAISQIVLLVVGIVSISYAIGGNLGVVKASAEPLLSVPIAVNGVPLYPPKTPSTTTTPTTKPYIGMKYDPKSFPKSFGETEKVIPPKEFAFDEGPIKTPAEKITEEIAEKKVASTTGAWSNAWKRIMDFGSAALLGYSVYQGAKLIGADETLSKSLGAGTFAGKLAYNLFSKGGLLTGKLGAIGKLLGTGLGSFGLGLAVTALVYIFTYKKTSQEIVVFECLPWDAQTKGENCELCNKQGELPCSEYQCRSLGQSCELINKGTDKEMCTWVNRNDINPPEISPWDDALKEDYEYTLQSTGISPPDRGAIIKNTQSQDGCVPAFTPLSFGITLNEPAKCKLDILDKKYFDEMDFVFSGSLSKYNHSYALSLPSIEALEAQGIEIKNDGQYQIYTRCMDSSGNSNTANFIFKFCVDQSPDTTAPLIVSTNPLDKSPFAYNETPMDIPVTIYTNEPADCKWSHRDQAYEDMENQMDCAKDLLDINAQMLYSCTSDLTGLKNMEENKFYFRCEDEQGNANAESYKFSLMGTRPLVIDFVKPNQTTIKDATQSIKITLEAQTSAGYNKGEATCEFGNAEDGIVDDLFTPFWTYKHSYDLWLTEGDYNYFIRCYDAGNNFDIKNASFSVETDTINPLVVRAYNEQGYLKIATNEESECVYDTKDCSYLFEDGIEMTKINNITHYVPWDTEITSYIKCQDKYNNRPAPNQCSIVVRAFE